MDSYSFSECTLTMLDRNFGLRQVFSSTTLDEWLSCAVELNDKEKASLVDLRHLLNLNAMGWNEQELSLHFIGPVFSLVGFTEPYRFNLFAQRKISAVITGVDGDIDLSGEPDGIIATGFREPEVPMFAFSEYKKERDPTGDPAGQALGAMLVGQALNQRNIPLYGAFVVGSDWSFMVLEGQQYMVSGKFSATSDEIYDILRILKGLKQIVTEFTAV